MMNKTRALILSAMMAFSLLCIAADSPFQIISKRELLNRIEQLEHQNFALRQDLSDLNRRMEVLTERVNSMTGPGTARAPGASSMPQGVPDLEVVVINPNQAKVAPPAKRGRVFIQGSDGDHSMLIEHRSPLPGTNYIPPPDPETAGTRPAPAPKPAAPPATPPPPAPSVAAPKPPPSPSPDEGSAYKELKALWEKGEEDQALPLMEAYVRDHRRGAHIDEVAYLLGEEFYQRGEHDKAIRYLRVVADERPESTRYAPEALFLIGLCHLELGQLEPAADALREVKILYPFSEAAVKADQELASCCQ